MLVWHLCVCVFECEYETTLTVFQYMFKFILNNKVNEREKNKRNTVHRSQQLHSDCMKLALTVKRSHLIIRICVSITVCYCFCTLIPSECCKTKYTYCILLQLFMTMCPQTKYNIIWGTTWFISVVFASYG